MQEWSWTQAVQRIILKDSNAVCPGPSKPGDLSGWGLVVETDRKTGNYNHYGNYYPNGGV